MSDRKVVYGIEELRRAVWLFDRCNETFNMSFTAEEILDLWRHATTRETDEFPDEWSQEEIDEVLAKSAALRSESAGRRAGEHLARMLDQAKAAP